MNKYIYRAILKIMASPKINMIRDYKWIRKLQDFFHLPPLYTYQIMERAIISEDGTREIPIRIFQPKNVSSDEILLFFHGGGWVIGNIDTYSYACLNLANETGRRVYSVDYRLAPENPFPSGLEDCLRVTEVLCDHSMDYLKSPSERIILMGDSAGANLAAVVSLIMQKKGKKRPHRQILIYPVTWWDHTENSPFESIRSNGYDFGLTSQKIQEYMELYCPSLSLRKSYQVAPLLADSFEGQPETLIITAEFDPLRDEGETYAHELAKAGVPTKLYQMKNAAHGFFTLPKSSSFVKTCYDQLLRFLNN